MQYFMHACMCVHVRACVCVCARMHVCLALLSHIKCAPQLRYQTLPGSLVLAVNFQEGMCSDLLTQLNCYSEGWCISLYFQRYQRRQKFAFSLCEGGSGSGCGSASPC